MQTFDRLKHLMENYAKVYPNSVSLDLKADGSGKILIDTSRGIDTHYTILLDWRNWKDLAKKLWQFHCDELLAGKAVVADKEILEDCRPNSYYR